MDTSMLQRILPGCSTNFIICTGNQWLVTNHTVWSTFFSQVDQMSNLRIHHTTIYFFHHENIFLYTQDNYEKIKDLVKYSSSYLRQCIMHKLVICQSLDFLQKSAINCSHILKWISLKSLQLYKLKLYNYNNWNDI